MKTIKKLKTNSTETNDNLCQHIFNYNSQFHKKGDLCTFTKLPNSDYCKEHEHYKNIFKSEKLKCIKIKSDNIQCDINTSKDSQFCFNHQPDYIEKICKFIYTMYNSNNKPDDKCLEFTNINSEYCKNHFKVKYSNHLHDSIPNHLLCDLDYATKKKLKMK